MSWAWPIPTKDGWMDGWTGPAVLLVDSAFFFLYELVDSAFGYTRKCKVSSWAVGPQRKQIYRPPAWRPLLHVFLFHERLVTSLADARHNCEPASLITRSRRRQKQEEECTGTARVCVRLKTKGTETYAAMRVPAMQR